MTAQRALRKATQRVTGTADAAQVSAALEQLRTDVEELRASVARYEDERAKVADELAALRAAVLDQSRAIEEILGRLDGGAIGRNQPA